MGSAARCTVGSSDLDKIFENLCASCSFGLAKDFFLYFVLFLFFFGFSVQKFEKKPFLRGEIISLKYVVLSVKKSRILC